MSRLCVLDAHVIINAHYVDLTKEDGSGGDKVGTGMVPMLETDAARKYIAAEVSDVVCLENTQGKRQFIVSKSGEGVWGPSGRRFKDGQEPVKANIRTLMRVMGLLPAREAETT